MVNALVEMPNGDLVAGGTFSTAGGVAVTNIARWNGAVWSPLGSGIQGAVSALAVLTNGDLVAGGVFTNAGGVTVNNLARWDGSTWSDLAGGVTGSSGVTTRVSALAALPGGALVVGGHFTTAGGLPAANVAQWNGTSWSAMGTGLVNPPAPFSPPPLVVTCLTIPPNGNVFAGTDSLTATNSIVSLWNGSVWSTIFSAAPIGPFGVTGSFHCLASLPNGDVLAGGSFNVGASFPSMQNIARWNGSVWSYAGTISGTVPRTVMALALLTNGDMVAAGADPYPASSISRWNGSYWESLGDVGSPIHALVKQSDGTLVAGGQFGPTTAVGGHRLARWGCDTGIASKSTFGRGCYWHASSFYERFDTPQSFDLSSSKLQLSLAATGYDVTHVPGAPAFATPPATAWIPLLDDDISGPITLTFSIPYPGGSTTQICAGSNGYVYLQPSTIASPYYGNTTQLLSAGPRHAALWGDLDPSAQGGVYVHTIGQTVYVTWQNVQEWNQPLVINTFQVAMSSSGNVEYRYLACNHQAEVLTGWSPGNGAQDPTERDLSTFGPFSTTSLPFRLPLQHAADQRPKLGSSVTLTTSGLPASSLLGLTIVGFTKIDPGIQLSSIGMPGCQLFASLDLLFPFFPVSQSGNLTIAIPNQASLVGFPLYTQGTAWDATANPFGMITSNGISLTVGNP